MTAARDRVLTVAGRLFAERGVAAVSMRDLASELRIQAPSLYFHFVSKESLVQAVCEPYGSGMNVVLGAQAVSLTLLLDRWRNVLHAHVDGARIVHGDPAVRDLTVGQLGRLHDLNLAIALEKGGVPAPVCAPLIAAFRSPYMQPAAGVDLPGVEAAGRLILTVATEAKAA